MGNNKDSLGDRMKQYENISRIYLTRRMPVIIRIDGKAFHSFTRGFARPFDNLLITAMQETAKYLCENIQGCKLAYTQSDEISLLLVDYDTITTEAWFDNNLQKMVSIAASMATMAFNKFFVKYANDYCESVFALQDLDLDIEKDYMNALTKAVVKGALFDARAFILPKEEVCNYFIWRQQDATRNSIQMVAQANFSHKELQNKSCNELQDMLHETKGINWNDYDTVYKRGSCVIKTEVRTLVNQNNMIKEEIVRYPWTIDTEIPIFTQERYYIEQYVEVNNNG